MFENIDGQRTVYRLGIGYPDFMGADLGFKLIVTSCDSFHKDKYFLSLPRRQHSAVVRDFRLL
jgi:hypothetical protein